MQLNTLNARPTDTHEDTFFFSGAPIPLKPQETGILNAGDPSVPGQGLQAASSPLLLTDIGWTSLQALDTRLRLRSFEEDWNAPGMEGYDDL